MKVTRLIAWLEYAPRGIRKAWCELTGGHDNIVCGTFLSRDPTNLRATHISLYCRRCERETRWYDVPVRRVTVIEVSEEP